MHEYYQKNRKKLKKAMDGYLKLISGELQQKSEKDYSVLLEEIWDFYEHNLLEYFPYIGGDDVSGTSNLTGAYYFVAMGEVLKNYGVSLEETGYLMVLSYERTFQRIPAFARKLAGKMFNSPKLLNKMFQKKDRQNAANALKNPGSFETKTMIPPEEGYAFSYHNLVCPLANFAKEHGYMEYMPYLCNLDYVMFGILGAPLYREKTCASGDEYCDFKLKSGADILPYWPPVFTQKGGCK